VSDAFANIYAQRGEGMSKTVNVEEIASRSEVSEVKGVVYAEGRGVGARESC